MAHTLDDDVIWRNTVDHGRFTCQVTRLEARKGRYLVTVTADGEVLLDQEVYLSWGAQFGPDVDDVAAWQQQAIDVIDPYIAAHDGTPDASTT